MGNDIELWLLIITLIVPRIGLLIAWLSGQIPYNTIPFVGDVVLAIFLPRLLMTMYIATNLGTANPWFWIHLLGFILAFVVNTARGMHLIQQGKNPYSPRSWVDEDFQKKLQTYIDN
jgi:hypothetical protein